MNTADGGADGVRQILRNGLYLLLAYVTPRVFTVAAVVVAARWLGTERFGVYGAAAAFAVILGVLASLGMLPLLVRDIAREPDRAAPLLSTANKVKAFTGAGMLGVAWLVSGAVFAEQPEARAAALVLCVGWAVNAFAENLAAYFQAVERMARWTQASAIFGITSATVGVALLVSTNSIVAFCWGFVVGWGAALLWLIASLPPEVRRKGNGPAAPIREVVRGLAPFAAAFIGLTVYCKVDVLLIERWSGAVQAGLYTAGYKFVDVFQALVLVAAGAIYPHLSRGSASGSGPSAGGRRATELLLLATVPGALTLFLLATPVVSILYGSDFAGAAPVVSRLALLLPLLSISILGGYVLGAVGRMEVVAVLYGVAVAVNVALNAWLIPSHGAAGAAWARLGSESVLLFGFLYALERHALAAPGRGACLVASACGVSAGLVTQLPDPTGGWGRAVLFLIMALAIYDRAGVWHSSGMARIASVLDWTARRRAARAGTA